MTTLSAKEKSDFAALDADKKNAAIKARLSIIRTAAFAGTLDRSSIDVALDELDALTDAPKEVKEPVAPNGKPAAFEPNPFKPAQPTA